MERRHFLRIMAGGGTLAAACAAGAGLARSLFPTSIRNRDVCRIGWTSDFPLNTYTYVPEYGLFVHRSPRGMRALSARCTHLGCSVLAREEGFLCPCHGSRFDTDGRVLAGAAQRDLPWLRVSQAPDGRLLVHTSERVSPETILPVS